jgi:prepilin-type N-terminal cleavage/methylation domain-containing protein
MRPAARTNDRSRRRGVTLLEMLVVVALVVLMMTILASIFQAATGSMIASRAYQELDDELRLLDMTIRQDLAGVTARMTPPLNPALKLGYFEYGENLPADLQGEDTDDYIAFTTKAPEGQFFTGRVWIQGALVGGQLTTNQSVLPTTITSKFAEVIYFLRQGNLYRRVLLIAPERKGQLQVSDPRLANPPATNTGLFSPSMFNNSSVSWMAVNDISARPSDSPTVMVNNNATIDQTPIPNDLGDLTNRENRYARPRFMNDYVNNFGGGAGRDGIPDDGNGDGIPDYWPTLTAEQVILAASNPKGGPLSGLMNEDVFSMPGGSGGYKRLPTTLDLYAFPFMYPAMYSQAEASSLDSNASPPVGLMHALDTRLIGGTTAQSGNTTGAYLNHAPLEFGDSLPIPTATQQRTTWWGFPTWRETASANWRDPVFSPSAPFTQALGAQVHGLQIPSPAKQPGLALGTNMLPPLGSMPPLGFPTPLLTAGETPPLSYPFPNALNTPFDSEGAGNILPNTSPFATVQTLQTPTTTYLNPTVVWEDDLIMTGVRSFDVKAFDYNASLYNTTGGTNALAYNAGYYDLGYASTDYVTTGQGTQLITSTPTALQDGNFNPQGFGHEGRMPPVVLDHRVDPQRPINNAGLFNFVGDDHAGQPRMRRVWDTWSTDYTNAPAIDINLRGSVFQPFPLDRPIYPSYPPPYPQPLRGLQIQIRVVDPRNERIKLLTIRQDFSDKL